MTAPNGPKAKDIHTKQKQRLKERGGGIGKLSLQTPSTQKLAPNSGSGALKKAAISLCSSNYLLPDWGETGLPYFAQTHTNAALIVPHLLLPLLPKLSFAQVPNRSMEITRRGGFVLLSQLDDSEASKKSSSSVGSDNFVS